MNNDEFTYADNDNTGTVMTADEENQTDFSIPQDIKQPTILTKVRYFMPLANVLFLIALFTQEFIPRPIANILCTITFVLFIIGTIFAWVTTPLKLLKFVFGSVATCFSFFRSFVPYYGIGDLIAAMFGFIFGFWFGVAVVLFLPSIFTIKKYRDKYSDYLLFMKNNRKKA